MLSVLGSLLEAVRHHFGTVLITRQFLLFLEVQLKILVRKVTFMSSISQKSTLTTASTATGVRRIDLCLVAITRLFLFLFTIKQWLHIESRSSFVLIDWIFNLLRLLESLHLLWRSSGGKINSFWPFVKRTCFKAQVCRAQLNSGVSKARSTVFTQEIWWINSIWICGLLAKHNFL